MTQLMIAPDQLTKQLNTSLQRATQRLKQLQDEDEILLSIEQDGNLQLESKQQQRASNDRTKPLNIHELNQRDNALTKQIDMCNKLWVIKGFLDQCRSDVEMKEFESFFYSLTKLQSKLKEFDYSGVIIIDKINLEITQLENDFVEMVEKLIYESYWDLDLAKHNSRIVFNHTVELNEYSELSYEELQEILTTNYRNNKSLLNKKLIELLVSNSKLDEILVQPLIKEEVYFQLESDNILHRNKIQDTDMFQLVESVYSVLKFIDQIPNRSNLQNYILKPILQFLEGKLLEENIELLIRSDELKERIMKLAQYCDQNRWFSTGDNILEKWVKDSINYWIDKKFKDTLNDITLLKHRISEDKGIFDQLEKLETDSWDWPGTEPGSTEPGKGVGGADDNDDDDDGWDAWKDEDEEDLFADEPGGEDSHDEEQKMISKIPEICYTEIIKPFLNLSAQIEGGVQMNIEEMLSFRLKDLLSALLIVLSESYQEDQKRLPFLFYNDFEYLLSMVKGNKEMKVDLQNKVNNVLEIVMNENKFRFIKIWNDTIQDLNTFLDDDNTNDDDDDDAEQDQEDEIFLIEFNEYVNQMNELIDKNLEINIKLTRLFVISNISFIFEFFIKKIFQMDVISELASQRISNLQKTMIRILKKKKNHNKTTTTTIVPIEKIKNYNKFDKISTIMMNNLKQIESQFNDGDFFDFETMELVQLIQLLFVESDLSKSLIEYIKEVRTE